MRAHTLAGRVLPQNYKVIIVFRGDLFTLFVGCNLRGFLREIPTFICGFVRCLFKAFLMVCGGVR